MERFEVLKRITVGLQDCRTANNVALSDHFTIVEIADFANTLHHYLPESLNARFSELNEEVFMLIADKEDFFLQLLSQTLRRMHIGVINKDDIGIELMHLMMISMVILNDTYEKEPEYVIDNIINYYKSLMIDSNNLALNVHEIPAYDAVSEFDNAGNYLRMDYNNIRFVPTLTTKQNFKYLIPKEWNL